METKQTAESTKTDAQFKIDSAAPTEQAAAAYLGSSVSNKLFEISDTLSAMLGCSKDDILNPLQSIVVGVVRSKRAALKTKQFEEFHKKGVEKVKKHANIFKQLHDLLGNDAMYYNQVVNLVALQHAFNEPENFDLTSCLAEMICKLDSFIRDIIETGSEKESVKQDTEILKGTKTSEDLDNLLVDIAKHKQYGLPIHLPEGFKKGTKTSEDLDKLRKRLKIHSTF